MSKNNDVWNKKKRTKERRCSELRVTCWKTTWYDTFSSFILKFAPSLVLSLPLFSFFFKFSFLSFLALVPRLPLCCADILLAPEPLVSALPFTPALCFAPCFYFSLFHLFLPSWFEWIIIDFWIYRFYPFLSFGIFSRPQQLISPPRCCHGDLLQRFSKWNPLEPPQGPPIRTAGTEQSFVSRWSTGLTSTLSQ